MAKYVLLQFDNDDEADKFVKETQEQRAVWTDNPDGLGGVNNDGFLELACFVRGVWKKPTKFCECKGDMRKRAFTRGRKYGWWVCNKCGKPTHAWGRGDHWFLALGRNLLPVDDNASEYRGDGVFGRYRKECPNCHHDCVATTGHGTTTVWCNNCQQYV